MGYMEGKNCVTHCRSKRGIDEANYWLTTVAASDRRGAAI
jgi:hypothetical protein